MTTVHFPEYDPGQTTSPAAAIETFRQYLAALKTGQNSSYMGIKWVFPIGPNLPGGPRDYATVGGGYGPAAGEGANR